MTFPESARVIYEKNPLNLVVCQFRFPPILRIDAEVPATFQEAIRHAYPLFEEQRSGEQGIEIPPEISKLMGLELQFGSGKQGYKFSTSEDVWQVVLTRDFLALATTAYKRWEDFKQHLENPLNVFTEIYKPDYFSRIGLRYRDVIKKTELGLKDHEWAELLQPHIAGELCSPIASSIQKSGRDTLVTLDGGIGQVRIRHGLPQAKDDSESRYVIDADFFSDEKLEVPHALERLDRFNREAGRLFRWCITDRLHNSLGPRSV